MHSAIPATGRWSEPWRPARSSPLPVLLQERRATRPTKPQKRSKTLFASLYSPIPSKRFFSVLTVPDEESDEKTGTHNGKSQIDVPSMQLPCGNHRPHCGQNQQKGSLALG